MNKKNTKLELYIIIFLILVFIGIIFVSFVYKDVEYDYQIENIIDIDNYDSFNEIEIGYVKIINNGFFPIRAKLNEYVICDFNGSFSYDNEIRLIYRGKTDSFTNEIFSPYNGQKYIDLKGNSESYVYFYIPKYYPREPIYGGKSEILTRGNYEFYLYDVTSENEYYNYGFCNEVDKNAYEKVIKLNIKSNN